MKHEPGFDEEAWQKYVDAGGCPSVDGKTWCNSPVHTGRHHAVGHDGTGKVYVFYWSHK